MQKSNPGRKPWDPVVQGTTPSGNTRSQTPDVLILFKRCGPPEVSTHSLDRCLLTLRGPARALGCRNLTKFLRRDFCDDPR
eukprot:4704290-Pyramimonas_sp.AAC.1